MRSDDTASFPTRLSGRRSILNVATVQLRTLVAGKQRTLLAANGGPATSSGRQGIFGTATRDVGKTA